MTESKCLTCGKKINTEIEAAVVANEVYECKDCFENRYLAVLVTRLTAAAARLGANPNKGYRLMFAAREIDGHGVVWIEEVACKESEDNDD